MAGGKVKCSNLITNLQFETTKKLADGMFFRLGRNQGTEGIKSINVFFP